MTEDGVDIEDVEDDEDSDDIAREPFRKLPDELRHWAAGSSAIDKPEVPPLDVPPVRSFDEHVSPDVTTDGDQICRYEPNSGVLHNDPNRDSLSHSGKEDDDSQQFNAYKSFVTQSDAYRWLVTSLRQYRQLAPADVESMMAIRTSVRDQLRKQEPLRRLSRRKPPAMSELSVKLDWNPIQVAMFYGFKDPLSGVLDRLYYWTGSEQKAQVITVAEYVTQTWPSTASAMIGLLGELVTRPEGEECSCKFSKLIIDA